MDASLDSCWIASVFLPANESKTYKAFCACVFSGNEISSYFSVYKDSHPIFRTRHIALNNCVMHRLSINFDNFETMHSVIQLRCMFFFLCRNLQTS